MGSTLSTLRQLLADQIDADTVTAGSDPSTTLLNTYINNSIRKITRRDRPRELRLSTAIAANITISTNSVSIPATVFVPERVYYQNSDSQWSELKQIDLKSLIQMIGPTNYFDSTYTGDPIHYAIEGTKFLFDKYFSRTASSVINIFGISPPTSLSSDSDTTELPTDYDILIVYESALLFAQRDDDDANINRWIALAKQERSELLVNLQTNNNQQIQLDPNYFTSRSTSINNPSVFFSS